MSNQIQSSNSKGCFACLPQAGIVAFDIHLTFACLPVGRDFEI
jgi:hypothetical protein